MKALNTIIRVVTVLIFPIGALLFSNMHFSQGVDLKASIESTSAAIIGMIPEGLILLVSTVLAVSVIRLSKKNVLVQDLYCIESLARVDTLCLDKTGTITEGKMILEDIIYISERDKADKILQRFTSCASDSNPTFDAIIDAFPPSESNFGTDFTFVPFSSSRKYSALKIDNTTYYLGAGDILCPDEYKKYTADFPVGKRILALCCEKTPMCFLVIKDIIKKNAKNILEYFKQQGVDIKIISGDSPETVSAVAKEAGVPDSDKFIDASTLSTLSDYSDAVQNYTIFGRVTPDGKEQLIKALQNKKHTVAMTGDGVNDVLALKAADCSIAMANGSSAARNVSHIILLDSDFASLPDIVCEGRRSINNIRRSASMFLVKTLFTIMLSLIYLFFDLPYPFIPIQLTLISTLTIGIPSFILALEPSRERVGTTFLSDIFKNAFPAAFCVVVNILILTFMSNNGTITYGELSTISTFTTGFSGLYLLFTLCTPFNRNRTILWLSMSISFYTLALLFGNLFEFVKLTSFDYLLIAFFAVFTIILFNIIQFIFNYLKSRIAK